MLSGGAHSMIHPFGVTGFNLLTALSTSNDEPGKASRPFDRLRDGFVLGDGGAMVILEELEHAKKRGAPILGEVMGMERQRMRIGSRIFIRKGAGRLPVCGWRLRTRDWVLRIYSM